MLFADIVNRADVRMIQCGSSFRFPPETLDGNRVMRQVRGQTLEGNFLDNAHQDQMYRASHIP
jgi:hypothetical protein